MDLLTQGVLGAAAAGAFMAPRLGRTALAVGFVAGLLPDADVLINAVPDLIDPALPWRYHRHATHAIVAIPVVAAVSILPWMATRAWRARWRELFAAALIGAATHAPLDACTSFGTHLWWPFTEARSAWDAVAIIDPMVTLPLLVGVAVALWRGTATAARIGLALGVLALALGFLQHWRAERAIRDYARARGESVERFRVTPTLGNTIVWRALREVRAPDGRRVARAASVRVPYSAPLWGTIEVRDGAQIDLIKAAEIEWPDAESADRARRVFGGLEAFSDGWIGWVGATPASPWSPFVVGDHRYSVETAGFVPLWGVAGAPADPVFPLRWVGLFDRRPEALRQLWSEILGDPAPIAKQP